jgi:plastocyanin
MAAFLFAAVTACGDDTPTDPGGGGGGGGGGTPTVTTNVAVSNNQFTPEFIQVSPGATVTWTWATGAFTHNVTFADATITDIPNQSSGAHTSTMPSGTGDYTYECTLHPGMTGTVRVQ